MIECTNSYSTSIIAEEAYMIIKDINSTLETVPFIETEKKPCGFFLNFRVSFPTICRSLSVLNHYHNQMHTIRIFLD